MDSGVWERTQTDEHVSVRATLLHQGQEAWGRVLRRVSNLTQEGRKHCNSVLTHTSFPTV